MPKDRLEKYRHNLEKRFNMSIEELSHELYFSAVFVVYGTVFSSLTL